jgi:hypothetical protein
MSGRDLAKQIVMRHPRMQVLYISGYADHPTVRTTRHLTPICA